MRKVKKISGGGAKDMIKKVGSNVASVGSNVVGVASAAAETLKCESEPFVITVKDCDGIIKDEAKIYDCLHANDIVPIFTVLIEKLGWILWPTLCPDNNFFARFLINGVFDITIFSVPVPNSPVHIVLFCIYVGILYDWWTASRIKKSTCNWLQNFKKEVAGECHWYDPTCSSMGWRWLFGLFERILGCDPPPMTFAQKLEANPVVSAIASVIPGGGLILKGVEGLVGLFEGFEAGDEKMSGKVAIGRCDEAYYNKDDVSFATDYTLWQNEGKYIPGSEIKSPGEVDYTCTSMADCYQSYLPVGVGIGNAPRKFKECCDLSLDYYGKKDGHSIFLPGRIPSRGEVAERCARSSEGAGDDKRNECGVNALHRGAAKFGNWVGFNFDVPEEKCKDGFSAARATAEHQEDKRCRRNQITWRSGCNEYIGSGEFTMDDNSPPTINGPLAKHAHNALVQFKREHDICSSTPLTTSGEQELGDPPGDYTLGCHPRDNGYDEKDCLGNFRKAGLLEEIYHAIILYIKEFRGMLTWPYWKLIKTFYKWVFTIFMIMWVILKIKESFTLKVIAGIVLYIYIYSFAKDYCHSKSRAPAFICSRIHESDDSIEPSVTECIASKKEPWPKHTRY